MTLVTSRCIVCDGGQLLGKVVLVLVAFGVAFLLARALQGRKA